MYHLAEGLRIVSVLIESVMPETAVRMREQLGVAQDKKLTDWASVASYGTLPEGTQTSKGEAIFPRIDIEKRACRAGKADGAEAGKAGDERGHSRADHD